MRNLLLLGLLASCISCQALRALTEAPLFGGKTGFYVLQKVSDATVDAEL